MQRSAVVEYLHAHKAAIADEWARNIVVELKSLAHLDRRALVDHIPELLDGLVAWLEGRFEDADIAFSVIGEGHAAQRLGLGVDLPVVNVEYYWLRKVIMTRLLSLTPTLDVREQIIALNEGLDHSLRFAVRAYVQQRDRVRDRFIGILGHDLRNPLHTASLAAAGLLRSGSLGERESRLARAIEKATSRMGRMVRDVLDFASGHLGDGIHISPVECDLGEICGSVVEEFRIAHPQRRIVLRSAGDLSGSLDRDRVFQAVGNLVSNALHHGSDPITVETFEEASGAAIIVRVRNSGTPIPPALVPRLFDPFVRAEGEPKGALGLGLFIVALIARAHDAAYALTSTDEETVVEIRWPRRANPARSRERSKT